jgi:hypothetical protein
MANQPPDGESVSHNEMVAVALDLIRPGQQPDGLRRELHSLRRFLRRNVSQEGHHTGPVLWVDLVRGRNVGDVVPGSVELDDRHLAAEMPCHELRGFRRPWQRAVLNRSEGHIRETPAKQHGLLDTPLGQPAVGIRLGVPCEV